MFYSLAGEGRGHAARAKAIIDELACSHTITVFAPEQAYDLLHKSFLHTRHVNVIRIPGICFRYNRHQRVDYWRTCWHVLHYLLTAPKWLKPIWSKFKQENPNLVVSDFEPMLPRLAQKAGVPFMTIDHQSFLRAYDLSGVDTWIKKHLWYMRAVVWSYYIKGAKEHVVSAFYFPPLKKKFSHYKQVGLFFRQELIDLNPSDHEYLLVYARRSLPDSLKAALQKVPLPVHIFGIGVKETEGNLHFNETDAYKFSQALANCRALLSSAGNQLLGEAIWLGKPMLVWPEPGNIEQCINAHFLENSGYGKSASLENVDHVVILEFLNNITKYQRPIDKVRLNGLPKTLALVEDLLKECSDAEKCSKSRSSHSK